MIALPSPADVAALAAEEIPAVIAQLASVQSALAARLLMERETAKGEPDPLLDIEQAAARLNMSTHYLYKNHRRLPFTVRQGRKVLFSSRGLERYKLRLQGKAAA